MVEIFEMSYANKLIRIALRNRPHCPPRLRDSQTSSRRALGKLFKHDPNSLECSALVTRHAEEYMSQNAKQLLTFFYAATLSKSMIVPSAGHMGCPAFWYHIRQSKIYQRSKIRIRSVMVLDLWPFENVLYPSILAPFGHQNTIGFYKPGLTATPQNASSKDMLNAVFPQSSTCMHISSRGRGHEANVGTSIHNIGRQWRQTGTLHDIENG